MNTLSGLKVAKSLLNDCSLPKITSSSRYGI